MDMFFMKTCSFNGAQPRLCENVHREGLFCVETPEGRFVISPCNKPRCHCCHPPCPRQHPTDLQDTPVVPFAMPHIHRFVNQYEAILNCPATCETTDCIYTLTCPCGHFDFVGHSKLFFARTLAMHREQGHRIIREFLIGEINTEQMTYGLKSEQAKAADKLWLYQHSARCGVALQLFLDYNPDYWCFVPMKIIEVNMINMSSRRSSFASQTNESSTSSPLRMDEEIRAFINNVPKAPLGFEFSMEQRREQKCFFQYSKDRIVPLENVDLYNADIVAVLPHRTSELFAQLIESLFITHAECKLNQIGHPIYDSTDPSQALQGSWCVNMRRRPPPSPLP